MGDNTRAVIELTALGGQKVKLDLDAVRAALKKVGDEAGDAQGKIKAVGDAAEVNTDGVEALKQEFEQLVRSLPGGQSFGRYLRLLEQLGDGTTTVGEAFKSAQVLVTGFSGSLKLLGAAGLAIAGIAAIVGVMKSLTAEAERATKAVNDQSEALTRLDKERKSRGQTIEDLAAKRKEGGFATLQEGRAARDTASELERRFPDLNKEAVNQVLGQFGGLTGKEGERTGGELAQLAFLVQSGRLELDPKRGMASNEARAQRAMTRFGDIARRQLNLDAAQRAEGALQAKGQALGQGGPITELEELIRNELGPGATDEKVKRLVDLQRKFGNLQGLSEGVRSVEDSMLTLSPTGIVESARGFFTDDIRARPLDEQKFGAFAGQTAIKPDEFADLTRVLQRLADQPRTVIQQTAPRIYSNDAEAEARRRANGETTITNASR